MNTEFIQTWRTAGVKTPRECVAILVEKFRTPAFQEAQVVFKKAREVVQYFKGIAFDFGDPKQFPQRLEEINKKLLPIANEVMDIMKYGAQGTEVSLAAQAFLLLVAAYDDCIKGLTSSALYGEDAAKKAKHFGQLLDQYLRLACAAMDERVIGNNRVLNDQAVGLLRYLPEVFPRLVEAAREHPDQALLPSSSFSVQMAALGSGLVGPERAPPQSLEDLFSQLHQSMLAVGRSVETRSGIEERDLPEPVREICDRIFKLDCIDGMLRSKRRNQPSIQSISYVYPKIEIHFNCPLRTHSGHFVLEVEFGYEKVGKSYRKTIKSIVFDGYFFAPPAVDIRSARRRDEPLSIYALSTYYVDMRAPDQYKMSPPKKGATSFRWQMDKPLDAEQGIAHLQHMISFLQQTAPLKHSKLPEEAFRDHPWARGLSGGIEARPKPGGHLVDDV